MLQAEIKKILDDSTLNEVDVFINLFKDVLRSSENAGQCLQMIIELSDQYSFEEDAEPIATSIKRINEIGDVYFSLLRETVAAVSKKSETVEEFYSTLYEAVFNSLLFPENDEEKGILLYFIAKKQPLIPFYPLENPLKMDDADYKSTIDKIEPYIKKAIYILNRNLPSRTEEASQLLRIASKIENEAERIVFIAVVVNILKSSSGDPDDD